MTRSRLLGSVVSVVVTGLAIATMAGLGIGAVANISLNAGDDALPCDRVPGTPQAFEGNRHVPYEGAPHEPYKTVPPTSGTHSAQIVALGIYREPVPEELQVHALEHGHVFLQYAPGTSEVDIAALERIGRRYPRDAYVAPYPGLDKGIALTGWQRLQRLDRFDEQAVVKFITTVAGRFDHDWQQGATDCLSPD
ncbi:MAG TPA: DUF3105 domain-containing protein [Candidatus Limnocylindrales bacterium]|nr:DUF3105 domain-containing protein [Candidatus Limnocylindrales bacterium]